MIPLKKKIPSIIFWVLLLAAWTGLGWAFWTYIIEPGQDVISMTVQGRSIEILAPLFFGVLLSLPLFWIIQKYTLSDLPRWQRWTNVGIRALLILSITGALIQVVLTSFESRIATIFVVDTSASMPDESLASAVAFINKAIDKKGERDQVRVLGFAQRPYSVELTPEGRLVTIPRAKVEAEGLQTNIAAAMRMAYGLFPQDHLKRMVLISDGNTTRGDFIAESYRAEAYGIRIYNKEVEIKARPEVLIRGIDAPEDIKIGEPFFLVARVFSTQKSKATISLTQNDFKEGSQKIELEKGLNEVKFKTQVFEKGLRTFNFKMKVDGEDHFKRNNDFVFTANVRGKPRVLYIEGEMRSRHYLERALRNENFEIETRGPYGLPTSLKELENFDLLLVSDLPALYMSNGQMAIIDRYVREMGGGFIMAGGESSFGPGGYYGAPIEKMMPVKFESQKKRKTPSLALMLVVDKSGSMGGDRIELAKDAAKAAVEILGRNDKIGVVAFDDGVQQLVRMQSATNRVRILSDISRLRASGGTNIAKGLESGYEQLAVTPARLKHIILLTDGNSSQSNIFTELLPAMRIENITVSAVAVGNSSDTTLLRRIAEGGNGRYYYTNDPYNVPRIFMKETSTISRSSLVEEPFRPRIVKNAQALKGIPWGSAPYLLGYVSTKAKPSAELLMQTEQGEPLLARWRYGMGKSVAFTSDLKNRWAVEWVRWPGYGKFWAQLIRDTMRSDNRDSLAMRTTVKQGEAHIIVDAIGDDDRFINDLDSKISITDPKGKKQSLKLTQTAPGRYEARVPLKEYGPYGVKAQHDLNGDTIAVSQGNLSYPYPQEYLFVEPNFETMRRAADIGKGTTNPTIEKLFDPMGEEVKYRKELWPIFVMIALALLIFDVLFRRLRLGGKTELAWEKVMGRGAKT